MYKIIFCFIKSIIKYTNKKTIIPIVAVILIVAAGFVWWQSGQKDVAHKDPIKIGVDVFPGWGHVFIAQEKGFFQKNGVDVEIVLGGDYLTIQEQFANEDLDGAFMVYADAIYANDYGIDVQVVYISDQSITGDIIIARQGLDSIEDLRGKTIGVEGVNSFSHLFVLTVLKANGLKETDFFIENIGAQKIVESIKSGEIDAGHTYGPAKFRAEKEGYSRLASAGDVKGAITDILAFHQKTIEQRPEEIQAIVRSLFEAQKFQETNKKEAVEIIAKAINDSPESVAVGISAVEYLNLKENGEAMQNCEEGILDARPRHYSDLCGAGLLIADFYLKRGQLSETPNLDELIESKFVSAINKEK